MEFSRFNRAAMQEGRNSFFLSMENVSIEADRWQRSLLLRQRSCLYLRGQRFLFQDLGHDPDKAGNISGQMLPFSVAGVEVPVIFKGSYQSLTISPVLDAMRSGLTRALNLPLAMRVMMSPIIIRQRRGTGQTRT